MASWGVAEAKAKLSEVLDRAMSEGPQLVTRRGRGRYVLVTEDEWKARTEPRESIAEFLMRSPLRGSGLVVPKRRWKSRKLSF